MSGYNSSSCLAGVLVDEDLTGFSAADDAVTFGQFPVSLAAALATIRAIEDDGYVTPRANAGSMQRHDCGRCRLAIRSSAMCGAPA